MTLVQVGYDFLYKWFKTLVQVGYDFGTGKVKSVYFNHPPQSNSANCSGLLLNKM